MVLSSLSGEQVARMKCTDIPMYMSVSFDKCIHPDNQHLNRDIEYFHHLRKFSYSSLHSPLNHSP